MVNVDVGLSGSSGPSGEEEEGQDPSILDPFKEKGILGGLGEVAPLLVPGAAQGQAIAARRQQQGGQVGLGDLFRALPGVALETLESTPGVGDAIGVGRGLFQDHLAGFDRGLQFAGIVGFVPTGVGKFMSVKGSSLGRAQTSLTSQIPFATVRPTDPTRRNTLASLSGNHGEFEVLYPTISMRARRLLAVDQDIVAGPQQIGAELGFSESMSAELGGLGQRLIEEVPEYRAAVPSFESPGGAAAGAMAMEAAKFEYAFSPKGPDGGDLLRGKNFDEMGAFWARLKNGEDLTAQELTLFNDRMVKFADATQNFGHPEFALEAPTVGVSHLNMRDDGLVDVGIRVLDFEKISVGSLTERETNRRLSLMFRLNASSMTPLMAENFANFFDQEVMPRWDDIKKFRSYYIDEANVIRAMAVEHGLDVDQLISTTSIFSAGELWETNADKALRVLKFTRENPGADFKQIKKFLKKGGADGKGLAVTDKQLTSYLKMMSFDQAADFWRVPLTRTGSLKTPAFFFSLSRASTEDNMAQATMLRSLMLGEIDRIEGAVPGAEIRDTLRVVSDRHVFAWGLGFSLAPDSWFGGTGPSFDAMSRALTLAAGQIGDVDGIPLLPHELQALGWFQWRENKGFTRNYEPSMVVKARNDKLPKDSKKREKTWGNPSNWTQDVGPNYKYSDNILNHVMNGPPQEMGYRGIAAQHPTNFVDSADGVVTPVLDLVEKRYKNEHFLRNRSSTPSADDAERQIVLVAKPDGSYEVQAPDGVDLSLTRTMYGSMTAGEEGQIMRPKRAAWVRSVEEERRLIARDTVDATGTTGMTGFAEYTAAHLNPSFDSRRSLTINAPLELNGGGTALESHRKFVAMMNQRGIRFEHEILPAHQGPSFPKLATDVLDATGTPKMFWALKDYAEARGFDPNDIPPGVLADWQALKITEATQTNLGMVIWFDDAAELRKAAELLEEPRAFGPSGLSGTSYVGASGYLRTHGEALGLSTQNMRVPRQDLKASHSTGTELALLYDAAPVWPEAGGTVDAETRLSYKALTQETQLQYDYVTKDLGIKHIVTDVDPYGGDHHAMMLDIVENKMLKTWATIDEFGHPLITNDQNDKFRFVHDYFGHAGLGNRFDRHGEEMAWSRHVQMYSDLAAPAMTSELRAQNSYLNFHPENVKKGPGFGEFGPQKVAIFPDKFNRPTDNMFDDSYPRVKDDLYKEQVLHYQMSLNGDGEAPALSKVAYENHFTDGVTRITNLSEHGDPDAGNTARVYLPYDAFHSNNMYDYVAGTAGNRHFGNAGGKHQWSKVETGPGQKTLMFDNVIEVVRPADDSMKIDTTARSSLVTGVKVDGKVPKQLNFLLTEGGPTLLGFNDQLADAPGVLQMRTYGKAYVFKFAQSPTGQRDTFQADTVQSLMIQLGEKRKMWFFDEWPAERFNAPPPDKKTKK